MDKMKRLLAFALLETLVLSLSSTIAMSEGPPPGPAQIIPIIPPQVKAQPRPMTLVEAFETITTLRPGAAIVYLHSVDDPEDSSLSGQDGRRRAWQAGIMQPDTESTFHVRLVDGTIVQEIKQPFDYESSLEKPAIDSPDAMRQAKAAKPNIGPITAKGRGVHFALESGKITVRASFRDNPVIVSLDSATGQILPAQRFTWEGSGGVLYSADGGQTWAASDLKGRWVRDVYSDPLKEDQAYAAVIEDDTIHLYQTRDGGKTWALMSDLPAEAGNRAFSLRAVAEPSDGILLLVGTWSGLWVSRGGKGWSRASGLPEGPKQWQGVVQSNKGYRVFVSITSGPDRGLYGSSDLSTWTREAAVPYRLSESYDRQAVLATNEDQRGTALLLNAQGRKVIALPGALSEHVLDAAGAFDGSAPMLLRGGVGVGRHFKQSATQTELYIGTLAVPRDFPTSQVAIAGGFRTGIYRSTDGGQTWHSVLSDPSALVEGRGEIGTVEFLSAKSVIAVNGGYGQWKEF